MLLLNSLFLLVLLLTSEHIIDLVRSKTPFNFSSTFPYFQLQFKASGKVTTPLIQLSNFGILGLKNDLAMMNNCQYDGRTMYIR